MSSAALVALVVATFGCGSESEQDEVRRTIRGYVESIDRGDARAWCVLLSRAARADLIAQTRRVQTDPALRGFIVDRSAPVRSCVDALKVRGVGRPHPPGITAQPGAFDSLDPAEVAISDDRATVRNLRLPVISESTLVLVRQDGRWRIDT
jgi:hypothetical protein